MKKRDIVSIVVQIITILVCIFILLTFGDFFAFAHYSLAIDGFVISKTLLILYILISFKRVVVDIVDVLDKEDK
ncbi:hypothetical protein [Miniphocaeibacter massiliensis]|uniref:hypothetical protein n=1 Tax=Miniphocaeibacter massiliensis TaxID=2041841 RepID=UPI000C1BDA25|nr:hypothetical protein [Miniphocaeibacter massiliensis]